MSARIGFIYFGAYPDIRVVKMTNTLAQAGYEVIVLARNIKGATEPGASHPYAHVVGEKSQEWRGRLQLRRLLDDIPERWRAPLTLPYYVNPVWRRAIRDLVVKDGCRLLSVRDMPLVLAATAVGKRYGVPVIFDMAENYPAVLAVWRRHEGMGNFFKNTVVRNVTLARMVERIAVRESDTVLVVVKEQQERVRRMAPSHSSVVVVENTPVLDAIDNIMRGVAKFQVDITWQYVACYFGVLHPFRSLDVLFCSLGMLPDPSIGAILIGGGKYAGLVEKQAYQSGVTDRVRFLGWQPYDVGLWICRNKAHVGVIPHERNEHIDHTMPNKVYDYMAIGLPIIVSDAPPTKRIVEETGCGLVFRSQDAEDLAEKVLMLRNPTLRAEMGARGRKAVEDRYNWSVDGQRFLEVVCSLCR
ncbi:MAG: glycosyltransferase [Armatimonadota bacterium]